MKAVTSFTRLGAVVVFAAAALAQPLALDACAVSCEAARAARTASVAPPCHHTTSCEAKITQAPSQASAPDSHGIVPAVVAFVLPCPPAFVRVRRCRDALTSARPPTHAQLRL